MLFPLRICLQLLLLILCLNLFIKCSQDSTNQNNVVKNSISESKKHASSNSTGLIEVPRSKRFFLKKKKEPGLILTVGGLIYQQLNETTSAAKQISNAIRSNIGNQPPQTSQPIEVNGTTTEAPYRISTEELFGIIRKNIRGLLRLLRIEVKDALNQTRYNIKDYKNEFANEIAKSFV